MATKRPAKIASKKKGKGSARTCPSCNTDMQMTRVMRFTEGPSGMFWVCTSATCMFVVSKHDVKVGSLLQKTA
ncbi:MAG: hypothetical protein H0U74_07535 [Bradymonadaceae bacterium]|nr:hypothetical protein [Lujinxingiaceae bacterium]